MTENVDQPLADQHTWRAKLRAETEAAFLDEDLERPHVVVRIDEIDGALTAHGPYAGFVAAAAAADQDRIEWEPGAPAPSIHVVRCHPPRR